LIIRSFEFEFDHSLPALMHYVVLFRWITEYKSWHYNLSLMFVCWRLWRKQRRL